MQYGGLDPCQIKLSANIDPAVFDSKRLDSLPAELDQGVQRLRSELAAIQVPLTAVDALLEDLLNNPNKPAPADLYRQLETQVLFGVPNLLSDLSAHALDVSLLQARARVDSVELTPIDMPWAAFAIFCISAISISPFLFVMPRTESSLIQIRSVFWALVALS